MEPDWTGVVKERYGEPPVGMSKAVSDVPMTRMIAGQIDQHYGMSMENGDG